MDAPYMNTVARGVAAARLPRRALRVPLHAGAPRGGRAEGAEPRRRCCEKAWKEAVAALGGGARLVIGGKSMGGRIASMVADELGVRGLVCLGYPFHPPGQPEKLRTAHLAALRTPALIVQGTRDPFGTPEDVDGYTLSPAIELVWIEDGDHSLKPRASSGRTEKQNLAAAIEAAAGFLERRG